MTSVASNPSIGHPPSKPLYSSPNGDKISRIAIIGAGISGLSTAAAIKYFENESIEEVVIFDQYDNFDCPTSTGM